MFAKIDAFFRRFRRRLSHRDWAARRHRATPPETNRELPGLLLIQIDGLSRTQFERAVDTRRMPFLRRLLRRDGFRTHSFYSGIPSTTAAVQAELFYGVRGAVPAFSYYDRVKRCHGVMCAPEWAREVESAVAAQAEGLLTGGSSWSNIYTGGATQEESHFCAASLGLNDLWRTAKFGSFFAFILFHPLHTLGLLLLLAFEFFLALCDLLAGLIRGEKVLPELQLVLSRVFVSIGLREIITIGAAVDLTRGLPVVHVNFVGYDEQAHRRGPGSAFALWSLRGIDRAIRSLYRAAEDSPRRDYAVWIYSDHGQERVRSFDIEKDGGIEQVVRDALELSKQQDPAWRRRSQRRPVAPWLHRPKTIARQWDRWSLANKLTSTEEATFTIAAIGPVGHVYFAQPLDDEKRRALAARLVAQGQVPGVLLKLQDNSVVWYHAQGVTRVPEEVPPLLPHPEPVRAEMAEDIATLARHPQAGDVMLLGWSPGSLTWTFAPERGAHAGLGPEETRGFALLPPGVRLPPGAQNHIRPAALRTAALNFLERAPLTAVQPVPAAGETLALRVLTYNTHACEGMDGRVSPRRIARVIAAHSPDIVALQEVDLGRRRSRVEDQAAIIARLLDMHYVFCPSITRDEEHYGHALLSRWPVEVVRRGFLPGDPRGWWSEPRAALWTRIIIGARPINVITTHLGLGLEERRLQMEALTGPEWLGSLDPAADVIFCGDLNAMPGSKPYRIAAQRLRDAQLGRNGHAPLRTFTSIQPFARIDHIFASASFVTERVVVPRDRLTRVASDHLPLVVDFAIGPVVAETTASKSP